MTVEGGEQVTLTDDGRNGDLVPGDFLFTGFVNENIPEFLATMDDFEKRLQESNNMLISFENRSGEIKKANGPFFDRARFLEGIKTEIPKSIFFLPSNDPDGGAKPAGVLVERKGYCREDKRHAALPAGGFTPYAAFSFGPPPPPIIIKKEKSLLITDLGVVEDPVRTFNPCNLTGNPDGAWTFKTLMKGLANTPVTGIPLKDFTADWLNHWMQDFVINGEDVINRAPKMLNFIIAPWINKARGGTVPAVTQDNWKEIWMSLEEEKIFYFSPFKLTAIVNRVDLRGNTGYSGGGGDFNAGETRFIYSVVKNTRDKDCGDPVGDDCFDGFNIIFEYGNVQKSCEELRKFAIEWATLSSPGLTLGSTAYNEALEKITRTVTVPSPASAGKPNGNALNQLRTNEIAITNTIDQIPIDRSPRWQFEEFRLTNPISLLVQVPLNNEPAGKYNGADGGTPPDVAIMANWVNINGPAILAGLPAGNVPDIEPFSGANFRAGKSNYPSLSPFSAPGFWDGDAGSPIVNDQVRHVFSLNTCSGCHSDETNTIFTHVNAVGLGTPMRYVGIADYITDGADVKTQISPFLTGRNIVTPGGAWGDDFADPAEDATDNTLTGLYFVKDPAGRTDPATGAVYVRGFNDLERRLQDLSNFIATKCRPTKLFDVAATAFFQPLNVAH